MTISVEAITAAAEVILEHTDASLEGAKVIAQDAFAAAAPFLLRVVTSDEGLLPGTVLQDKTGDVLKLMDNGEWWATDCEGPSFTEYPATVLVEGGSKNQLQGYYSN